MNDRSGPVQSVLETIGETPLVKIHDSPTSVDVYAKVETFNPGGSVKDRIGKFMLERLIETGELSPGDTIIEPTAGNTGIGMAIAAKQLDLTAIFVVPERFSQEKVALMDALGGRIINVPTDAGMAGAIDRAHHLAAEMEDAIVPQQFSNPLNVKAHYETTAPEIFSSLDGHVGAVVLGCGTAGTLMGIGRYAKERNERIRVVGVEPEGSLFGETLGQSLEESEYKIEGIGTHDLATNRLFDPELVDEFIQVSDRDAHREVRRLATEEGHMVASSAGAASVGARTVARWIDEERIDVPYPTVVTLFPDSSERYISKGLYRPFEEWVA